MNRGFYLGKIFGIPIRADMSVLILAAYILLAWGGSVELRLGIAAGLLFSIVWHELAHSLAAMAFGGKVRDITLQLMGGCAAISEMPRKAWQEWVMAAAGPVSSFLLAGIAFAGAAFIPEPEPVMMAGKLVARPAFFAEVLGALAFMNIMLGFFNLLPAFPMDGGRILRATLQSSMSKVKATWIASRIGRAIAIIFIVTGILNLLGVAASEAHQGVWRVTFLGNEWVVENINIVSLYLIRFLTGGSWIKILIGFSIFQSAEMEYRMVLAQEAEERQQRGFGGGNPFNNPFGGNPFGSKPRTDWSTPPDDDSGFVSPPPYSKGKPDRVDIKRGE